MSLSILQKSNTGEKSKLKMAITDTALLASSQAKGITAGSNVKVPEIKELFSPLNIVRYGKMESRVKITFHEC